MQKNNFKCGIYKIENVITNKMYIGFSKQMSRRWYNHKRKLNKNTHDNLILQHSWNLHGKENFIFEIIEECLENELIEKEKFYINKFNTIYPNGFNIHEGGLGGNTFKNNPNMKQIKKNIKKAQKGLQAGEKNPMYGKIRTPRKWMNNNYEEVWVKEEECLSFITKGWNYGRLNKNRIWVNKNKKEKWIPINELKKYTTKGWTEGRSTSSFNYDKTRIFISPTNETYIVANNLLSFCKKHNLNYNSIIKKTKNKTEIKYNKWIIKTSDNKDKKLLEEAERNKIF